MDKCSIEVRQRDGSDELEEDVKVFACDRCDKKYHRHDYLERHMLNHDRPASACPACGKTFARTDVLRKHLSTACRVRAVEGDKPEYEIPLKRRRVVRSKTTFTPSSVPSITTPPFEVSEEKEHSFNAPASLEQQPQLAIRLQLDGPHVSPTSVNPGILPAKPGIRPSPARVGASLDLPLAPAFAMTPDTLNNLNFNPAPRIDETNNLSLITQAQNESPENGQTNPSPHLAGEITAGTSNPTNHNMDDLLAWLFNTPTTFAPEEPITPLVSAPPSGPSYIPPPAPVPFYSSAAPADVSLGMPPIPQSAPLTMSDRPTIQQIRSARSDPETKTWRAPQPVHPLPVTHQPNSQQFPPFPDEWTKGNAWTLPPPREVIDAESRNKMIEMFEGSTREELLSPAFGLRQMRLYLEMYFLYFAPLYPIIHRPSLGYRRLPPDLLLTMICIGTTFDDDKSGFLIASRIHKRLRNRIFEMVEEEPRASMTSLQTILLINHFSRSFCSLKEHDVAHIFHSPSIIMARLSGVFLPSFSRPHIGTDPLDHWLEWVSEEERKRVGWFAFMMDTENAALFRHYLLAHCYSLQIDYPCDDSIWSASEPISWNRALRSAPKMPSFRNTLREIAGRGTVAPNMTEATMWILLHGLLSVSWTLLWRDLGDLSFVVESKITQWKDSLRRALGSWREYVTNSFLQKQAAGEDGMDMHIYWVGIPFAHLGCILLLSDTEQIRIFAGASNIAGRPISPGEWKAAAIYVNSWARSQDGAYSCYAALERKYLTKAGFDFLSLVARFSLVSRVAFSNVFVNHPLVSIVIWAYTSVLDGADRLIEPYIIAVPSETSESYPSVKIEPSLARRDALAYLARLSTCGHPFDLPDVNEKNKCAGVIAYTAHLAGTLGRGVMDESRKVLLGLLTEHL